MRDGGGPTQAWCRTSLQTAASVHVSRQQRYERDGGDILLFKDGDGNILGKANGVTVFKISVNATDGSVTLVIAGAGPIPINSGATPTTAGLR